MNIFADNAKKYAAAGLAVFPIAERGKTPLTPKGFHDATTDEAQVALWSEQFPNANIGIATGESGLVVLDVDVKGGGLESFKALCKAEPAIYAAAQATRAVRTGTGGYHYYFKAREGIEIRVSAGKLGPGLDIRAVGGYVVAPPSVNSEGNPYTWHRAVRLSETPEVPLELVAKLKVEKWSVSEKLSADPVGEGGRNDYLMRAGCSMRAKGFEEEEILAALMVMNQGRCAPPLDEDEVRQIAGSVARYERGDAMERVTNYKRADQNGQVNRGRRKLSIKSYNEVQEEKIDWLWAGRIAYAKFQLLVGMPGKTKSYLTHKVAACVSNGERLPGDYINLNPEPHDVLFVSYEDGEGDTIKPRLRKCGADMSRIHTVEMDKASFTVEDIPQLVELLEANPKIRLVVIDPVQNMMVGVKSNSDEEVRQALNPLIIAANRLKVAILGIKHLNKDEKLSIDNRIGGSIGYTGLARGVLVAGIDNEKEFGPNNETYAGVVLTKGNLAGRAHGILYEVSDNGLTFLGEDPTLTVHTVDRLLPMKRKEKKDG